MFQLKSRLGACADFVRAGKPVADVGTDHAYLPIWLLRKGVVPRAVASDIRSGPLESARKNAEKYGVADKLSLLLSDGLREVSPEDAEDVVIAGMGGELILRIVLETPWLRCKGKRLVLQPMSSVPELRQGLAEGGFQIMEEKAVIDSGKPYSVFSACYIEEAIQEKDGLYPYMGKLSPGTDAVALYGEKMARELINRAKGAFHEGRKRESQAFLRLAESIRQRFVENGGD